jgi:hypothetical protein
MPVIEMQKSCITCMLWHSVCSLQLPLGPLPGINEGSKLGDGRIYMPLPTVNKVGLPVGGGGGGGGVNIWLHHAMFPQAR